MRRPALVLALLLLTGLVAIGRTPSLAAPPPVPSLGGGPATPTSAAPAGSNSVSAPVDLAANKALVKKMIDAVDNAHDLNAIDIYYAKNYVDHEVSAGQPTDLAGFKAGEQASFAAFPDLTFTVEDIVAEGSEVWTRSQMCGTQKGPIGTFAATGIHICIEAVDIVRIENGKIAEHWGVSDNLSLLQQLGVIAGGG